MAWRVMGRALPWSTVAWSPSVAAEMVYWCWLISSPTVMNQGSGIY